MESSIAVFLSRQPACERLLLNQTKRRYAPWTASRDIAHNAVVHRYRHLDPAHGTYTGRTSITFAAAGPRHCEVSRPSARA